MFEGVRGQGDDPRRRTGPRPDPAGGLESVELRHLHVHENDVVGLALDRFHREAAVLDDVRLVAELLQHAGGDVLVDRVVLGDQQPEVGDGPPIRNGGADRPRRGPNDDSAASGQLQDEGRADTGLAFAPQPAIHQVDQPLADREAKAGAAEAARHRSVGLLERLEQPRQVFGVDADAGVAHLDEIAAGRAAAPAQARAQLHLAASVNLTALPNRLIGPGRGAADRRSGARDRGVGPDLQGQALRRAAGDITFTAVTARCQRERLLSRAACRPRSRQVEDVVDDRQQDRAARADRFGDLALGGVEGVADNSSAMPITPFIGVRISWLMLARNWLLARWRPRPARGAGQRRGTVADASSRAASVAVSAASARSRSSSAERTSTWLSCRRATIVSKPRSRARTSMARQDRGQRQPVLLARDCPAGADGARVNRRRGRRSTAPAGWRRPA